MIEAIRSLGFVEVVLLAFSGAYIATWIHETGHAAAGLLAGFRVTSIGLGFGRPALRFTLGDTIVFASLVKAFQGMTTSVSDSGPRTRASRAVLLAGGFAANAVTAAALLAVALSVEAPPAWLSLFGLVNAGFVVLSAVPATMNIGGAALRTDAAQMIALFRSRPGASGSFRIRDLDRFVAFLTKIGDRYGQFHYRIHLAAALNEIGNHQRALEVLGDVDGDLYPAESRMGALLRVVRGTAAAEAGDIEKGESDFTSSANYFSSVTAPSPLPFFSIIKARKAFDAGRFDEAERLIDSAGNGEVSAKKRLLSAELSLAKGDHESALKLLEDRLQFPGLDAIDRWRITGQAHSAAGRTGQALDCYKEAADRLLARLARLDRQDDREAFVEKHAGLVKTLEKELKQAGLGGEFEDFRLEIDSAGQNQAINGYFSFPGLLSSLSATAAVVFVVRGFLALAGFREESAQLMITAGMLSLGSTYFAWTALRSEGVSRIVPGASMAISALCLVIVSTFSATLYLTRRLVAREIIEIDANGDGKIDGILVMEHGLRKSFTRDSNFDGVMDTWAEYQEGKLKSVFKDNDGDGHADTESRYRH